jgi:hypothetical protein
MAETGEKGEDREGAEPADRLPSTEDLEKDARRESKRMNDLVDEAREADDKVRRQD